MCVCVLSTCVCVCVRSCVHISMYVHACVCVCVCVCMRGCTLVGQYSESVYFGPLKVREKKCLRNGKSFVELENYVAL